MTNKKPKKQYQVIEYLGFVIENLSTPITSMIEFPPGSYLPLELTLSLKNRLEKRLAKMELGEFYTLMHLCGKNYWYALTDYEREIAYRCVDCLIQYAGMKLQSDEFNQKRGYFYY